MTKKGIFMQNLKNIKSLNENQIDSELEQIVKYFQNKKDKIILEW